MREYICKFVRLFMNAIKFTQISSESFILFIEWISNFTPREESHIPSTIYNKKHVECECTAGFRPTSVMVSPTFVHKSQFPCGLLRHYDSYSTPLAFPAFWCSSGSHFPCIYRSVYWLMVTLGSKLMLTMWPFPNSPVTVTQLWGWCLPSVVCDRS